MWGPRVPSLVRELDSHMPQLSVHMLQLKILHATTKKGVTCHNEDLRSWVWPLRPSTAKERKRDFPNGTVDKNPLANVGDMGLIPGPGRFHVSSLCYNSWAHALELSNCNCWAPVLQLLKPVRLEPMLPNQRSRCNENLCPTSKRKPRSPELEKEPAQQQRPRAIKKKVNK